MSDEKALLAAIWEHPHDDTVRLVYADWLQENGQPDRAEFIRVQCERARLDEWDDAERVGQLKRREEALWPVHRKAWKAGLPKELQNAPFRRGFAYPRRLAFGGDKFLKVKSGALDTAPQWALTLRSFARQFEKVFTSPLLVRVDELAIEVGRYPHDVLEKLADNGRLRNVSALGVGTHKSTPASLAAFLNGPAAVSVTKLWGVELTPGAFEALSGSRTAARVSELDLRLWDADFGSGTHFSASTFPNLRALRVHHFGRNVNVRNATVRLVTATSDTQLRKLDLHWSLIDDAGAEQLSAWPGLANLRWLDLNHNVLGEAGYRALARSPHANNLAYLKVDGYWLRELPEVKAELDARFGDAIRYG